VASSWSISLMFQRGESERVREMPGCDVFMFLWWGREMPRIREEAASSGNKR